MKYSEIKKKLKKAGCYIDRQGSNHEWWFSPITNKRFAVSRHNTEDAREGTKRAIGKQSGVEL
ncbi:MAG: type II toxin-antitoxin system HicA family toxin [Tenacibaculum sp.]|nr:type II toxin-antitoxin system HicA family toxin [Tenacibaculum sp.]